MANHVTEKTNRLYTSAKLPWIIIGIGILLQLRRYIYSPSLEIDGAGNALTIITQSFSGFFIPSPSGQTVPYGFLVIEKIAVLLFGNSEYALLLFPLLSGILSLFLLYKVAAHFIKPKAIPIALSLFALSDHVVYYSSMLKPYTLDIAVALLLYRTTIYVQSKQETTYRILLLGILGAAALWISHPSVFVLAGIGATLSLSIASKKDWAEFKKLSMAYLLWIAGFISVYLLYTRNLIAYETSRNSVLYMIKERAYMPLPPTSLSDIQWFIDILFRIFDNPVGIHLSGIGVLAFLVGCVSIFKREKQTFFLLLSPGLITLLVSGLHMYGFVDRYILFLVPSLLLFVAEGAEYIRERTWNNNANVGNIIIVLLLLYSLVWSAYHVIKPSSREEIKPVLTYVKNNWQEGDVLYVYYMSQFAFEYYSKYHDGDFKFNENQYMIGKGPRDWYYSYKREEFTGFWNPDKPFSQPYSSIFQEYVEGLNKLKGRKRVWFLFSSKVPKDDINEEKFFIYHLDTIGKQLDSFGKAGVSAVYLYNLSN